MRRTATACLVGALAISLGAQPPKPPTLRQVWTLDATFRDAAYGVSFRYPSVWKQGKEFGMHRPGLAFDEDGHPVTLGFDAHAGPYEHTNLEGFAFSYEARPLPNAQACWKLAASLANDEQEPPRRIMVAGVQYRQWDSNEGGMSQYTGGPLLATWRHGVCFLFEESIASVNYQVAEPDEDDPDAKLYHPFDERQIERQLQRIMASVRFGHPA